LASLSLEDENPNANAHEACAESKNEPVSLAAWEEQACKERRRMWSPFFSVAFAPYVEYYDIEPDPFDVLKKKWVLSSPVKSDYQVSTKQIQSAEQALQLRYFLFWKHLPLRLERLVQRATNNKADLKVIMTFEPNVLLDDIEFVYHKLLL
jgi:hypothetical protein